MLRISSVVLAFAVLGLTAESAAAFQSGMARGGAGVSHGGAGGRPGGAWAGGAPGRPGFVRPGQGRYGDGHSWARGRNWGYGWGNGWGGGAVVTVDRSAPGWMPPPPEPQPPLLPVGVRPSPVGAPVLYRIETQGTGRHRGPAGAIVVSAGTPRPLGGTAQGWAGGLTPQLVPLVAR